MSTRLDPSVGIDQCEIDNIKECILKSTHIYQAIDMYKESELKFSDTDLVLIRSILFNKLINSNPLGLFATLCKLSKENMRSNELSKFLGKKGGSIHTIHQWMEAFENLGYVDHHVSSTKSKYEYFLKKDLSDILTELPPSYRKLIKEKLVKDSVFIPDDNNLKEIEGIIGYINCINSRLSYIIVRDQGEEPFETTKIIKTLLDSGATISESFYVLDAVSKELEYLSELMSTKKYLNIKKENIPELIKNVLEKSSKPEMDHLLYWYTAKDIVEKYKINYSENAANILINEILNKKWKKSDSTDIFYKAFENIYGCSFNKLSEKDLLLDEINNFIEEAKELANDYSLKSNDASMHVLLANYRMLTRNIALSIQINIGRLGSHEYPVQSLINIIKKAHSPTLKISDLNIPFEFISRLRNPQEPLSKFLYNKFSPSIQSMINSYDKNDIMHISFKRELINGINSIIMSKATYNEVKNLIDISPARQQLLLENKDDLPYVNRLILDDFFSDSILENSLNKRIRYLQLNKDYKEFILALESIAHMEYKYNEENTIEVLHLIYNLQTIRKIYRTLDF